MYLPEVFVKATTCIHGIPSRNFDALPTLDDLQTPKPISSLQKRLQKKPNKNRERHKSDKRERERERRTASRRCSSRVPPSVVPDWYTKIQRPETHRIQRSKKVHK
jgi:hypothetical protein